MGQLRSGKRRPALLSGGVQLCAGLGYDESRDEYTYSDVYFVAPNVGAGASATAVEGHVSLSYTTIKKLPLPPPCILLSAAACLLQRIRTTSGAGSGGGGGSW